MRGCLVLSRVTLHDFVDGIRSLHRGLIFEIDALLVLTGDPSGVQRSPSELHS